MRHGVLAVLILLAGTVCSAQISRNYGSNTGFGNVLYPGTGHAPIVPAGGLNGPGFGQRGGQNGNFQPGRPFRSGSNRTVVVPFPVYYGPLYGGGYGGGYEQAPPQQQYQEAPPIINTNTAPSVVINQTFVPERAMPLMREYPSQPESQSDQQPGMRLYEGPRTGSQAAGPESNRTRRAAPRDDQPTLYLIAFKDHSIVQALGYWVEDGNLHYVSAGHTLNQISLDLIDRETSQQLNDERNVEFKLPR